jgi:probable phosphoglycerate mutase
MHTFLDSLIQAHTPLSSPLSTPGPGTPLGVGMAMQTPIAPKDPGRGTVLVCTHESNILALLKLLLEPDLVSGDEKPFEVMGDVQANQQDYFAQTKLKQAQGQEQDLKVDDVPETPFNTHSKLRKTVMAHTSNTVDMTKQCGNTALCVVRVWWEPELNGNGLKACGRVEAWGDVDHLDE